MAVEAAVLKRPLKDTLLIGRGRSFLTQWPITEGWVDILPVGVGAVAGPYGIISIGNA